MHRRHAIKLGIAGGAGLLLGVRPLHATDPLATRRLELIRRAIPSSGELLPVVGLGTARTLEAAAGDAGQRAAAKEVIRQFVETGGTLIDTAPSYGRAELLLGELVRELGVAERLFTATKVGARGREQGIAQMEESMARLAPQDIDLMQVHNLTDVDTQLATLREWQQAGRIRYLGVTTSSARQYEQLEAVMRRETLDFVQLDYSIDNRGVEERLLPLAQERGMAVLVNLPFGRARLFQRVAGRELPTWARGQLGIESWAQYFLKFILGHPAITAVIPATSNPRHVVDNMGAAIGNLPEPELRARMIRDFEAGSA